MNANQKDTAMVVAAILATMMLFPPYVSNVSCGGYDFILATPKWCNINIPRLLIQWLCVIVVGAIMCVVQKDDDEGGDDG